MKKLITLITLLISFSSFAEWGLYYTGKYVGTTADGTECDFEISNNFNVFDYEEIRFESDYFALKHDEYYNHVVSYRGYIETPMRTLSFKTDDRQNVRINFGRVQDDRVLVTSVSVEIYGYTAECKDMQLY